MEAKLLGMDDRVEQVFLSPAILRLMREAARVATAVHDPFVPMRALLLAMLDDAQVGPGIAATVSRSALEHYEIDADAVHRMTASRAFEPAMVLTERAALARFDTLAFKVPDGSRSVWLSREVYSAFVEGARRVEEGTQYLPKHLAYGIAADAIRAPGLLSSMHVSPGTLSDAIANM